MLWCRGCQDSLDEALFYPSSPSLCKACCKEYQRAYREKKREELAPTRPADWKKKTADRAAYRKAWLAARPGYSTRKKEEWLKKNPEKLRQREAKKYQNWKARNGIPDRVELTPEERELRRACRTIWRTARKRGKVLPQACAHCGAAEAEGHHEDYTRPLDVIWLCKPCHVQEHNRLVRSA